LFGNYAVDSLNVIAGTALPEDFMKTIEEKNIVYDKTGYRIYPGDLLRSWHYGKGRGTHYLYHVAVMRDGILTGVPAHHLDPTLAKPRDGVYPLWLIKPGRIDTPEIVAGYGPGDIPCYRDRPKQQVSR